MTTPRSYLLCGTPRTGSTLLCSLLSSTGVLGRPESYFREADEAAWAARFDLATDGSRVRDYTAFVQAVRAAATTANGVFAARIMWGSLERMMLGLQPQGRSELAALEHAFGPLLFVQLLRDDIVGQAVSWHRAEQTGFWQPGDAAVRPSEPNVDRMKQLVDTIRDHNAAWQSWFDRHGIRPHPVTYEQLVHDPRRAVENIATRLGVRPAADWQPCSPHRKQADEINVAWSAALHAALDA